MSEARNLDADAAPTAQRYAAAAVTYAERGFGVRLGGGSRPAFIVVDLAKAFTDPANRIGWDLDAVVEHTRQLLDVMREDGHLIVFLTVVLEPAMRDNMAVRKVPAIGDLLIGTEGVQIDEGLGRRGDEPVVTKQFYSGFFGTSLTSLLSARSIDTVLLGGTSTSGCVRATAMDAIAHGFRPLVVEECCGDRSQEAHEANLFDIDQKYGDVISHSDALSYLRSISHAAKGT